jgi:hypothetical protein
VRFSGAQETEHGFRDDTSLDQRSGEATLKETRTNADEEV